MLTVYGNKMSGNCYKVKLTCALLNIDYQWVEVDILIGESRESGFLVINPLGQVPVLKIDSDSEDRTNTTVSDLDTTNKFTILLESNAIMRYLADNSWLIPDDPIYYAQMWQWLLYEQTEVRANIGPIRFIKKYQNMIASRQDEYQQKFDKAQDVLSYLDKQFASRHFILGHNVSLADISLYAYSHVADEGGVNMSVYPHLQGWFERIESLDNFVSI